MNNQTRQAYDIDNRRAGTYTVRPGSDIQATDDEAAKQFLAEYTTRMREEARPNISDELRTEDRFITDQEEFRNMFTPM